MLWVDSVEVKSSNLVLVAHQGWRTLGPKQDEDVQ